MHRLLLALDALTLLIQILVPVLTFLPHFNRNLPFELVGHASELYVAEAPLGARLGVFPTAETPVKRMEPGNQPESLGAVGWYAISLYLLAER